MSQETPCLRCGGSQIIHAHLQHPLAFCLDHAAHHGVVHVGLKALLCEECGHVEFVARDPSQILGRQDKTGVIQEEDF